LHQNKLSRLLPDLNHLLLTHSDVREAFPQICRRLNRVLAHQHAVISLYDPESARFHVYAQHSPPGASLPKDLSLQLEGSPCGAVYRSRQPIVVDDLRSADFNGETAQELLKHGRRSGCWAPLQTADSVLGAFSVSSGRPGSYRVDDAYLLNEVAGQVSLALASQLAQQQLHAMQAQLREQTYDWNRSFRDIAATAACGVVQWGADGLIADANDFFLTMVGHTRDDIRKGLNCSDLTDEGPYLGLRSAAEEALLDHGSFEPFQQEYRRPDGTRVAVLVSSGILNQKRPPWNALVVDLGSGRLRPRALHETPSPSSVDGGYTMAANSPAIRQILLEVEQAAPNLEVLPVLAPTQATGQQTLRNLERDYIARILHDTNGVVGGNHGAASILGMKRTTLQYKMKKLDIPRR
jgi:transcriptional regulator with GAF, ATPase, and Fis domain